MDINKEKKKAKWLQEKPPLQARKKAHVAVNARKAQSKRMAQRNRNCSATNGHQSSSLASRALDNQSTYQIKPGPSSHWTCLSHMGPCKM